MVVEKRIKNGGIQMKLNYIGTELVYFLALNAS